ncbi:galactose-specific lectin nattectin-like [Clarias gariepinus]
MGVQPDLKCLRNWSQLGERCFRVFTTTATWDASEQNCITMGAHLASVHNDDENNFVGALVFSATNSNPLTWIGASDLVQVWVWVWTDGSAFTYSPWAGGQPDNNGNVEKCVEINFGGGWNDRICTSLNPSVCAKPAIPARIKSVIRLKIISEKDFLASYIENLLQQVRQKLLDSGMPSDSTLLFQRLYKKST